MAKRSTVDVSDICQSSPNISVSGVVTSISPMKKSKRSDFFEGAITDGKSSMRIFGFDSKVRRKLLQFSEDTEQPLVLQNCEVKHSRLNNDLEIMVTSHTDIENCDRNYDIDKKFWVDVNTGKSIVLKDLEYLDSFDKVTLQVKVTKVDEPIRVKNGKQKQDIVVNDNTGSTKLTVWEQNVNQLKEGKSYNLMGMLVREYGGTKYLSPSIDDSSILEIDDIGHIEDHAVANEVFGNVEQLNDAQVIGVIYVEEQYQCLKCNSKVIATQDPLIGKCSKCHMLQYLHACMSSLSAKMMIKNADTMPVTLLAFGTTVQEIAHSETDKVTDISLLKSAPFNITFKDGIIQSVTRLHHHQPAMLKVASSSCE